MQVEITGKIVNVLPTQSGQGSKGEWVKNAFVIEWQDNGYTQKLCLEVMGADKWEKMRKAVVVGNEVMVKFGVSSREYNRKYYTTCVCWYCASVGNNADASVTSEKQNHHTQTQGGGNDLPF